MEKEKTRQERSAAPAPTIRRRATDVWGRLVAAIGATVASAGPIVDLL